MRFFIILVLLVTIAGCKKKDPVASLDALPGNWRWESTCGGTVFGCRYSSKSEYATIEFTSDGKFIEKHNDTVFLQLPYTLTKYDDMFGSLQLGTQFSLPVSIINNRLLIDRFDLQEQYSRMK
jgi:hypothetical protein